MPGPVNMPALFNTAVQSKVASAIKSQSAESKKMQQACEDFESLFINHMLQQMRQTVPQNDLFGGGNAEQLYTSMLDGELAKAISHQRGIGLSPILFQQMNSVIGEEKK